MNPNIARRRHAKATQAHQGHEQPAGNERNHSGHAKINVGDVERQISMIGGTVLAVCGLLRGSLSGLGLAAIGGALIWRGHTGHCEMYHMLGHSSADQPERGSRGANEPAHEQYEAQLRGYESHAAGESH